MGCLKAIAVRIGCLVVLVAAVIAGAVYHREIFDYIDAWRGHPGETYLAPAPVSRHADAATQLAELNRSGGPAYVDLTAGDLATLIEGALSKERAHAFDSVQVALLDNEVRVRGSLDIHDVPRSMLGPFASVLGSREPASIGGPLSADSAGRLILTVTYLKVGDFPLPRATISRILDAARLPGARNGKLPLPLAERIGDVRVSPAAVRFYRKAGR
ncbi:MAG TPA: hypothetical protein VGI92_08320 [Gemmatimonadales bacterium]|jgi:hypothetical protein